MAAARKIRHSYYYPAVLLAIFLGALLLRCWPRLISPQVWAEDGTQVLSGFINDGWMTFFQPVNGYWQLIGKLISAAALSISLYYYPLAGIILTCFFTVLVGLAVALSPTLLRGRFLCALAIFFVPLDAEIFGLPLYAFWWAGILLLLLALWDSRYPNYGWRAVFLLVGGLSSPVVVLVLPVLYYRVFRYRGERAEPWLALLGTLIAILQITFMLAGPATQHPSLVSLAQYIVPRFFGGFLLGNIGGNLVWSWLFGLAVIAALSLWFRDDVAHEGRSLLLYLLAGTIALSVVRVDPAILSTRDAGPRYFFYPFVILFWSLIQLYFAAMSALYRWLVAGLATLAILNMLPVITRFHADLEWQAHVRSCRLFPAYSIPVEVDGKQMWPGWDIELKGEDCDRFLRRDSFFSMTGWERQPTFAYTTQRANRALPDAGAELVANTMPGGDVPSAEFPGFRIIGSYQAEAVQGMVRLRLKKGARLLYRSGPDKTGQYIQVEGHEQQFLNMAPVTNDWIDLAFTNSSLPAEFVVRIQDAGAAPGQWSAIALPEISTPR